MTECFFTNLQEITTKRLLSATKSIKVAVAWINFNHYGPVFSELLKNGVKIEILLNDDRTNQRYIDIIESLKIQGAKIQLVKYSGIMHHKFCVIDNYMCLFGSFNWTENANIRNIEGLNICTEDRFVNEYLLEFNALWELSKSDMKLLRNPKTCNSCGGPIINIMFMEGEDEYSCKIHVMQSCACRQFIVFEDFFDICVLNNYQELMHEYEDEIIYAEQDGDEALLSQYIAKQDFISANYLI